MDAWQAESGLGVGEGEDPSNFDFDETRWTWTTRPPPADAAASPARPSPASFGGAGTGALASTKSPRVGTASTPAAPLSISTPWLWLSTSAGGGGEGEGGSRNGGGPADLIDMESISSRLSSFFSGAGQQQAPVGGTRAAGASADGQSVRGGTDGSAPVGAGGALGGYGGGGGDGSGEGLGTGRGGTVTVWQEEDSAVAELKNLARALQAPAPWTVSVQRSDGSGGWNRSTTGRGGVRLDLSSAQTLQSALQRGGFMPRGKTGLSVDAVGAVVASGGPSKAAGGGASLGDGDSGDVGDGSPGGRGLESGGSHVLSGGRGGPAPTMIEGGGDYAYSQEGGVMAYFDDGPDGRRRRLLLPPPPVGREEAALVCKLFRLTRDLTSLRVHRGMVDDASVPQRPLALEMFPALQELRLEGIPLEYVEGLPTLRLQLKLLSFEGAPLSSLVALLAIYAGFLPDSAARPFGRRGSASNLGGGSSGGGGGGDGGGDRDGESGRDAEEEGEDNGAPEGGVFKGGGNDDAEREGEDHFDDVGRRGAGPEKAPAGETAEASSDSGGGGDEEGRADGGVQQLAELGLEGLQSRLGMGTPMLHWSLLETLSVSRCGLLELDPSLRLLPAVRRLSLAHNHITRVDFFQDCASLEELDLSYNCLESVENVHAVVGNLRSLKLRGNLIARTTGLERMFSLEDVDLAGNRIHGLEEAGRLSTLPLLRRVWLEGNPLEEAEGKAYRVTVLSLLYKGRGTELDRVARLASKTAMGVSSIGISTTSAGDEDAADGGGSVGVALDGRLPSKKEIGRLAQLCFTKAAEDCNDGGGDAEGVEPPAVFEMKNLGESEAAAAKAATVTDWEIGDDNDEFVWAGGGAGKEEGGVIGEGGSGYRGDVAYSGLLIAEHLELFFRQQVFNGSAPYLLYEGHPTNLPPAMRRHREASKTAPEKIVAIFRETVLPCLPPAHHHHFTHHRSGSGAAVTSAAAAAAALLSGGGGGGGGGFRGSKARGREGGGAVAGVGGGGVVGVGSSAQKTLAATGMIQQVHRRAVNGEARGVTMGEVACVVVATETSVFFIDGGFTKKSTLFWEAPWPRVLLVLPLAAFERTTIGFRLQKLEVHFDLSACGGSGSSSGGGDDGGSSSGSVGSFAAVAATGTAAANGELVGGEEPEERISVVLLTRDRSRTFNLLQTLEPLATKARKKLGLPPTAVDNRDEATLEAIAHALPPCRGAGARVPGGGAVTDNLAPSSPTRQALIARPSTTSSWSPVGSPASASSPTKEGGPVDDSSAFVAAAAVPVAVLPSTTEVAGADTAAAIAAAAEQPIDRPGGDPDSPGAPPGSPGVFRRVGKWAGKLVSKNKRGEGGGVDGGGGGGGDDDDGDGVVEDGPEHRAGVVRRADGERGGEPEDQEGGGGGMGRRRDGERFDTAEGGRGEGLGRGDVDGSERAAGGPPAGAVIGAVSTPNGEREGFSLVFPGAAPPPLAAAAPGGADEDSRFLSGASGEDGGSGGGSGGGLGGVDCFGNGGAVVVFQLLMQRWRLRPWVVVPRTLVATKEQLALMDEDHSRIRNTNDGSSLLGVPWETATASATAISSPDRSPRDVSPPRAAGGGMSSQDRGGGWSGGVDPGYFGDLRRTPSFNDANDSAGVSSPGGGGRSERGGAGAAAGGAGWSVGGEMSCVDSVDLGDVLDVRQEESAPEQVVIEMKGEKAFDKRRHWRLQCRTGANAERVASAVLRLSLERARQRRLASSWWKR
eukprot:g13336.t1